MGDFICPVCNEKLKTNREISPNMVCLPCWQDYPEKVKHCEETKAKDQTIKQLEDALRDVGKALEFYAATSSWGGDSRLGSDIDESDCTYVEKWCESIGGKRARETLQKHSELLSKINKEIK